MRTGAKKVARILSTTTLRINFKGPPNKRAFPLWQRMSMILNSFGINKINAVAKSRAIDHSGCHTGQLGKRLLVLVKYTGLRSTSYMASAVLKHRKIHQSRADI
jgi:hypothetical protein